MDDTPQKQKIVIASSGNSHLQTGDYGIEPDAETENGELLFDNERGEATLRASKHKIKLSYSEDENAVYITTEAGSSVRLDDKAEGVITVRTAKGNVIEMNDPDDLITLQNAGESDGKKINKAVLNGKDKTITLDSKGNTVTVNGDKGRTTFENKKCKVAVDGNGRTITLEDEDTKVILDGAGKLITLNAKNGISLKTDGELAIDAKGGVSNKGQIIKLNK
jgi:hypothetical protein